MLLWCCRILELVETRALRSDILLITNFYYHQVAVTECKDLSLTISKKYQQVYNQVSYSCILERITNCR